MSPRRLIFFWILLVLVSLGLGGVSLWLLVSESRRIEAISAQILEEKATGIQENLVVILEETQIGLMDSLQSFPETGLDQGLEVWTEQNPFVGGTFTWDEGTQSLIFFGRDRVFAARLEQLLSEGIRAFTEAEPSEALMNTMIGGAFDLSGDDTGTAERSVSPEVAETEAPVARKQASETAETPRADQASAKAQETVEEEVLGSSNAAEARQRVREVTKDAFFEQRARGGGEPIAEADEVAFVASTPAPAEEAFPAQAVAETGRRDLDAMYADLEVETGDPGLLERADVDGAGDALKRDEINEDPVARLAPFDLEQAENSPPRQEELEEIVPGVEKIETRKNPWEVSWRWIGRGESAQWVGLTRERELGVIRGVIVDRDEILSVLRSALPSNQGRQGALIEPESRYSSRSLELIPGTQEQRTLSLSGVFPGYQLILIRSSGDVFDGNFWVLAAVLLFVLVLSFFLGGSVLLWMARQTALASQQKTDFLSNVSHELKTPLTTIRMYSEMLEEQRVKDPERRNKYLRTIGSETQRLARLVNNILEYSALQKGKSRIQLRETNLAELLSEFCDAQGPRVTEAGMNLEWNTDLDVVIANVDPDAVEQVLLNLLDNALKYAPESEFLYCILEADETTARIHFYDEGPGIPASHHRQVFDAFHRVDNSLTQSKPGSGLGLSIARSLLRQMSGDLRYKASPSGGACFILEIPLLKINPKL